MDGQRFDALILMVATKRSRRQLAQGLVASGVAALALRLGAISTAGQEAETVAPGTCSQDSDCMEAAADPCTGAYCDAGSCTYTNVACLPDHICCGNGACCPAGGDGTSVGERGDQAGAGVTETSDPPCSAVHSAD